MLKNISIALATAALLAAPAVSARESQTQTVGVSTADIDLATEEGREELDRRIDEAARSVCGMDDMQTGTRVRDRESVQCYRDAKRQLDQHFAELVDRQTLGG